MGTPADDVAYLLCAEDVSGAFQLETAEAVASTTSTSTAGSSVEADGDARMLDGDEESIAEFIGGEAEHSPQPNYPGRLRSRSVDPAARAESVAWILKVQEYYGFLPLTAYLAVSYMDRFLSLHRLPGNGWSMQLLAVTCFSLAAKMEETLVPSILDLQIEGTRYMFESRTICRMELLVLNALDWRLRSITPFTFMYFFAYKVDSTGKHTRNLIDRATQVTLAAIHDIEFLDHCPSSIAAAAVLCASREIRSPASIDPGTVVSWCIGLDEGAISRCYQLMQQLQRESAAITTTTTTTTATTTVSSEEVVSSSSFSSRSPSKRRKRSPDT